MEADFWRQLQLALRADAQKQVELALKAAVLLQHGLPQHEIRERLGLTPAETKDTIKRLRLIADQIDFELPAEHE